MVGYIYGQWSNNLTVHLTLIRGGDDAIWGKAHWWWFQANLTINVRISGINQFKQIFLLIGSLFFFFFNFSQIMPIISISFIFFWKTFKYKLQYMYLYICTYGYLCWLCMYKCWLNPFEVPTLSSQFSWLKFSWNSSN